MRLFGREFSFRWPIQAAAPLLPDKRTDGALTEVMPPFGTNPPTGPFSTSAPDMAQRFIHNDPRELWYLALPSKLTPKQVLQILRSALGGDIWQQWQLLSLMLDSWPMLRKCSHEIRQAVSGTRFIVRPYAEEGEEPTKSATDKAATVGRAMKNFRPDPMTDEKSFPDMVYDLTDGMLNGLTMSELMWYERDGELLPRASAWVHPRHFTFGNDGRLAVFDDMYNRLHFATAWSPGAPPPRHKFLVAQFMSRSGSSLGAGLMRPLAWDWSAVMFNRDWMLNFAQRYGNPFLDGAYAPGTPSDEVDRLNGFMNSAGSQGWITHPSTATLQIHPAQSLGQDNPQAHIMKQADEHCMLLLLGQTATTHSTPGKLGQQDVHNEVKRENVQGVANWVARVLTDQLAYSVTAVNYGEDSEVPTVVADFTEETDPVAEAQRDQVFITNEVPMDAEEFYGRHNLKMPEPGDRVLIGGQLGVMGDTDVEISPQAPEPEPPQPPQVDPETGLPAQQVAKPAAKKGGEDEPPKKVAARLKRVVAECTDGELEELRGLLVKARAARHPNGEWHGVQVKVAQLSERKRQRKAMR